MDKLTGLLVRKEFMEQLDVEVKRVVRYRRPLTVLMVDIQHDYFHKDEDIRWSMGNSLIKQMAAILQECYRNVDLLSRFEGEIFCVALPETGTEGAHIAAERLRKMVEEHEFLSTQAGGTGGADIKAHDVIKTHVKVAVNVGVATYPEHGKNIDELLESAKRGMEESRAKGGNQVVMGAGATEEDTAV